MTRILRIGLTGGIASGKSAIARLFAEQGVPVIDTDEIARRVVMPGQPALQQVVAKFGPEFLDAAGALDRRKLRTHVFARPEARQQLEAILHPHIERETLAACTAAPGPYQVLVVPLLLESGFHRHVDRILVVDSPVELQRQRLLQRDAEDPAQVQRILAAQAGREARLQRADDVIDNSGSLEHARAEVTRLHQRYLALAQARAAQP